jgi:hypothetical protein
MTCDYLSIKDGRIICRVYGAIEASPEKLVECQSDYYRCHKQAKEKLMHEAPVKNIRDGKRKEDGLPERVESSVRNSPF